MFLGKWKESLIYSPIPGAEAIFIELPVYHVWWQEHYNLSSSSDVMKLYWTYRMYRIDMTDCYADSVWHDEVVDMLSKVLSGTSVHNLVYEFDQKIGGYIKSQYSLAAVMRANYEKFVGDGHESNS